MQELGYDCVQWSPVIYDDLLRWGDGTGPGLIKAYFSRLGWPIMLGSKDRPAFVEKVYEAKIKHLKDMVQKGDIPLRSGEEYKLPPTAAMWGVFARAAFSCGPGRPAGTYLQHRLFWAIALWVSFT